MQLCVFGFQGLRHDAATGTIDNRARLYLPGLERFAQRDPLGYPDGMNGYAAYHVVRQGVDPSGQSIELVLIAGKKANDLGRRYFDPVLEGGVRAVAGDRAADKVAVFAAASRSFGETSLERQQEVAAIPRRAIASAPRAGKDGLTWLIDNCMSMGGAASESVFGGDYFTEGYAENAADNGEALLAIKDHAVAVGSDLVSGDLDRMGDASQAVGETGISLAVARKLPDLKFGRQTGGRELVSSPSRSDVINQSNLTRPPENPTAYSTAFETTLDRSVWGKTDSVHFNRANAALDAALKGDLDFCTRMEQLIPGVADDVSSVGGRVKPAGWTWKHASSSTAGGRQGVMRLVPTEQHTPGSAFWRVIHPDEGASGGYAEWARPAGAPKRN